MTLAAMPHETEERRKMALTKADIEAIVDAVYKRHEDAAVSHLCRFDQLDPEMAKEALAFFKSFNEAMSDTKKTVRRWLVIAMLTGTVALLGRGVWMYLKEAAKVSGTK